jgi:hypothetical protein
MLTGMREEDWAMSWRCLTRHARGEATRVATTEGFSRPNIISWLTISPGVLFRSNMGIGTVCGNASGVSHRPGSSRPFSRLWPTTAQQRISSLCSTRPLSAPRLGGWGKRGQETQALGRSRGGFSTKIHIKTDLDGLPLAFDLTGGEASDSRHFQTLLDIGPDIELAGCRRRQGL